MRQENSPGEKVVELAALARIAALSSGAIGAATCVWGITRSWTMSSASFFAGAGIGLACVSVVSRILFRSGGMTKIVKAGVAALPAAISAGLAGAIPTVVVIAAAAAPFFRAGDPSIGVFERALACGVALGIAFGCLGALL